MGPRYRRAGGWLVHLLTATGGALGVAALVAIHHGAVPRAFWLLLVAVAVDSVDGALARWVRITESVPEVDGTLLDNLVDYLNYVVVPAFLLATGNLVPTGTGLWLAGLIAVASAYQFAQRDAKTADHFFKGFPSYWNIVVLYFFLWETPLVWNFWVVVLFAALVFVPVKYVYPSRLESFSRWSRVAVLAGTLVWGLATVAQLWLYPRRLPGLIAVCGACIVAYFAVSIHGTLRKESSQAAVGSGRMPGAKE
jgi:phosphatidylcholine synthase